MLIDDVIATKGSEVYRIDPDTKLLDAVAILNEHKIGALVVVTPEGSTVGIVTERDVLRACHERFAELASLDVRDVMTREIVMAEPDDDVDYALLVMSRRGIRHLPVFDRARLVGLVSIVDLVRAKAAEADGDVQMLHDYVGGYPPMSWKRAS